MSPNRRAQRAAQPGLHRAPALPPAHCPSPYSAAALPDKPVRVKPATSGNNEIGTADQRKSHTPEGAKNNAKEPLLQPYDSVAVVGSIIRRTSVILSAGKPLRLACS